jgi:hypothetical protein
VIPLLFALNLVIYFWGNHRRQLYSRSLRRAVSRQGLISELSQNLNDIQKQVTLLSQWPPKIRRPEQLRKMSRNSDSNFKT